MEMNQTNPSGMNMGGGMPNMQTPSPAPKHKSHGGLIAAIVIVIVAAIAAVLLIGKEAPSSLNIQNDTYMNTTEGDTVILDEDASDDLDSIENDLESLDIEGLDSGLQ